jgi:hypothetical protein
MGTITRSDVQAFVSAVSGKVAPSTTETVYAVLRAMMQHAVDDDPQVIPANPCTRIKLPKSRKRVVEPLPATAVLALLTSRCTIGVGACWPGELAVCDYRMAARSETSPAMARAVSWKYSRRPR